MSFSVMLIPTPGSQWHLDADAFIDAVRSRAPHATVSAPYPSDDTTMIAVSTEPDNGPGLSAELAIEANKDGYFSIQAGTGPDAAELFALVRDWLGPDQSASILQTSGDGTPADVPHGSDAQQISAIIRSLT